MTALSPPDQQLKVLEFARRLVDRAGSLSPDAESWDIECEALAIDLRHALLPPIPKQAGGALATLRKAADIPTPHPQGCVPVSYEVLREALKEVNLLRVELSKTHQECDDLATQLDNPPPIPITLNCPCCGARHIDEGEFATRPHKRHSCQKCGINWTPSDHPTVGVRFLPGCKTTGSE